MLADKLEAFDNIRRSLPSGPRRHVKASETVNYGKQVPHPTTPTPHKEQTQQPITSMLTQLRQKPSIDPRRHNFLWNIGRVCADTGSSHSIAGEKMYQAFKDKGLFFQETTLAMSLANGQQTTIEALRTQVMVEIEGRSVLTKFIIPPKAKGNRALLGTDFLSSAGMVLNMKNACWYFWDNPTHKYPFGEELDTPSIPEKMSSNTFQLREGKVKV
ncbi:retrovirus-related Pol polyprotein from transposon 297 [Trichonephila clavipes]|nr:retrovirus-related Pol polyprotein from transposon 297 [Trichonephila clavipes]